MIDIDYHSDAERSRLLARLEVERDATLEAIRKNGLARCPEALWEHGRFLTRQIRLLLNQPDPY